MTKPSDYLGHDLGLGGFNTDAIDLTDVAEAEARGEAPPALYLIVRASAKRIGSELTSDGRRLKVSGPILEGYRLDDEVGAKAIAAMRVQRRKAEDEAAGVANLFPEDDANVPDVGVPHKVDGNTGTVLTDAEAAAARGDADPMADLDAEARAALADAAKDDEPDGDGVPRWVEDDDGFEDPNLGPADDDLAVEGDSLPAVGVAYIEWAWTTGNPLDAEEAKVIDTIDGQDDFALWELDLLLDLEHRGLARDEVVAALSGRRTAELALRADEEPLANFAKLKVGEVEEAVTALVASIDEEAGEEDVLGALKALDAIERFETTHKARSGVLKALTPAREALLGRLFPGAAS